MERPDRCRQLQPEELHAWLRQGVDHGPPDEGGRGVRRVGPLFEPEPRLLVGERAEREQGPAYVSTTTDGGKTWSAAKPIYTQGNGTLGNQLIVLTDGTLVDFFTNFIVGKQGSGVSAQLDFVRSTDRGNSWSNPTAVSDCNRSGRSTRETRAMSARATVSSTSPTTR